MPRTETPNASDPAVTTYRPHDLLWLATTPSLHADQALPSWAPQPWPRTAPVVVRRAAATRTGHVAIGLRGLHRHERVGAEVDMACVVGMTTPEDLARLALARGGAATLPCLQALAALAPLLDASPLVWGVTGGVGFMLASGIGVLRDDSDLDLVVRAPSPSDAEALRSMASVLTNQPARVDMQVETPLGAFALPEWLRTGGPVLLKTPTGPRLVGDPWAERN